MCRARFNTRIQRQNESVDSFIQDLYRLADDCGYGTMRDILICDRIVVGVNDEALSDRMQINKNLKLEDAVEMARQSEARKQNRDLVRGGNVQTTNSQPDKNVDLVKRQQSTHKFKQKQRYSNSGSKGPIQTHYQSKEHAKTCPWCGNSSHFCRSCPAKDAICVLCKKKGHFQSVCRSKNSNSTRVHTVEMNSNVDINYPFLGAIGDEDDWTEKISVDGQETMFKLDTGASVSVLSDSTPWLKSTEIQECMQQLKGPGGTHLQVIGTLQATLTIADKSAREKLYVIRNQPISLLSRSACISLALIKRNRLQPTVHEVQVPDFRSEFPELFVGLGKLRESYNIKINKDVTPTCLFTPRRVTR